MKESKAKKQKEINIWLVIIIALVVLILGLLFSYSMYQQNRRTQIEVYLNEAGQIIAQSNADLADLNVVFSQFKGDPNSAAKVLPKFEEGQLKLKKTARKLRTLDPPPQAKRLQQDLVKLYTKSSDFCKNLALIAEFVMKRNEILNNLSQDTEKFMSAATDVKTDQDLMNAAKDFQKDTDEGLKALRDLKKPSVLPYSNKAIETYMTELSKALADLSKATETKNLSMLQNAAARIKAIFSQDWVKAQTEEDAKGLMKYRKTIKNLESIRDTATREQGALSNELD